MKKTIQHVYEVILADITALGSLVSYGVITSLSLYFSVELFWSLVISVMTLYLVIVPTRLLFFRERPKKQPFSHWIERIDSSSFPSLHAGRMGLLCGIFMGFSFYYVVVLIAVLVCVSRILLQKHYMSDVLVGFVLGLIIGILL